MNIINEFVSDLAEVSLPDVFNPYRDRCDVFDRSTAPKARRNLLENLLRSAASNGVDSLWIGRDLGYRGGRRTGLALTDEIHVDTHLGRWGLSPVAERVVKGTAQSERTASVIWGMLEQIEANVFLWNVFPFHPHEAGSPFTNRTHSARERALGEEILSRLIEILGPSQVVAIGQDAAKSANRIASNCRTVCVRHPSYGGLKDFQRGVREAFSLAH